MVKLTKIWIHRAMTILIIFSVICLIKQNIMLLNIAQLNLNLDKTVEAVVLSRRFLAEADVDSNFISTTNITKAIVRVTDELPEWRQYTKTALAVFILSAIGSNSTTKSGYRKEIILNGWEGRKHRLVSKKCCIMWQTGKYSVYSNPRTSYWKLKGNLPAIQYACPIKGPLVDVVGIKLEFYRSRCSLDSKSYQKIVRPSAQKKGSLALCAKIVYGNIDEMLLVDWMEFYREMKVDKVFMFTYNLTMKVEEILNYYSSIGFLERKPYDYPWKAGAMARVVGHKSPSVWQDEQVTVFDCAERLQGYTYLAIIDLDEFLLPRKHKDIKTMLTNLTTIYPKTAGFTFKSYIFAKDWNATGDNKKSDIFRYLKRTPALYTREKNIVIRQRIIPGSMHTHEFKPRTGFNRTIVHESVGAINHYRVCYSDFKSVCDNPKQRFRDTAILKVADRFQNTTLRFNAIRRS